jgi:hypothetical protein
MRLEVRLAQPDPLVAQFSLLSSSFHKHARKMDIVSSASAVVGLVFNFATAAKTCKAVRGRYKDAALTIDSIRQE